MVMSIVIEYILRDSSSSEALTLVMFNRLFIVCFCACAA